MHKRHHWARTAAAFLSAGILLQAASCSLDVNALVGGLLTTIATDFIGNLVFHAFNLAP
jgi:uncharacterized membrane-anchored protein